jgi:hypothetical protein
VVLNTLLTSLLGMHGPVALQEMNRGLSATASQVLPRPLDRSSYDGVKRIVHNGDMWKRILASVLGTAMMNRGSKGDPK